MKLQSLFLRTSLLVSAVILSSSFFAPRASAQSNAQAAGQSSFAQTPSVPARITQAIDETQLVRLKGNVHPLARPEFDQGAVPDSTPMNRMLMVLQRSAEQQAALSKLMDEQLSKDSPNYHKWLTPQQFGAQFGPADADIQTVTDWLTRQGFQGIKVAAGRTVIEFSGNVGQVRNALHTEIHRYLVNGEARQANSMDPQIPAALSPVVAGIVSLHNFPRKSMKRDAGTFVGKKQAGAMPLFTTTAGHYVVGPADFAKIYNVPNGLNGTKVLDGTGVTIALVADSNINFQDVANFRSLFGLSANFSSANIILNGPDPGIGGPNSDEGEAVLDAEMAGMVAPGATINVVVSEGTLTVGGIDLSALYIIDNNIASVMSESFGLCEPALGTGGNQFYNAIWEQAASQGLSVMVSAGDNGPAGCDDFLTQKTATRGLAVSGIASTPFNVAVGGTDFDDAGNQTTFWAPNSANAPGTRESALGYIPEIPWNDSCAATATSTNLTVCVNPTPASLLNISGGSGGPSSVYTKTQASWQNGITPTDGHRDLPDVSLFASTGPQSLSFYPLCEADIPIMPGDPPICMPDPQGHFTFFGVGGTSASSPAFAGIIALINQQQGGPQGNPNPVLYKIAATPSNSCNSSTQPLSPPSTCVFYDVTKGNNSVPCTGGSLNCSSASSGTNGVLVSSNTPAWTAAAGYDMATGLGSVNVANLAAVWKVAVGAFKSATTSLTINGSTTPATIAHGSTITAAITVSPTSGTVMPTGDVALLAATSVNGSVSDGTLTVGTTNSSASIKTIFLPGGGPYNVTAHYAGDGTFAPSDSNPVPVTVTKENSSVLAEMVTFDAAGNVTSINATSFPYGSGPTLRMDVLNHSGNSTNCQPLVNGGTITGCALDATGSVTVTDNGTALPESPVKINSAGFTEDQIIQLTGGTHAALVATYGGDISYNASPALNLPTITVTPAATTPTLTPSANPVPTNQQVTLSVTIATQSISAQGPTGSVTFKDGSNTLGTATVTPAGATSTTFASGTASMPATFATTGAHSLTAAYGGDTNYATSTSSPVSLAVGQTTTTTVTSSSTNLPAGGGSVTLTATVTGTGTGASPTGTVQFMNGSTMLGTAQTCTAVSGSTPKCTATLTTTLSFFAPPTGPNRLPKLRIPWFLLAGMALLMLFLLSLKRVPARYRRVYAGACLLLLAGLVASLATACNGGYGGGGGGLHYDNITAVYSGDATYAGSTSAPLQITIQ